MKPYLRLCFLLIGVLLLALSTKVYAYTASDYYKAGLQLYNAKNYTQAVQYFSAALSLDPNNVAALQGRGNCHYALGQYQEALADYQKVQAIAPSPQLSQFIQAVQTKLGTTAPGFAQASPGTAAAPSSAANSFDQGVALYQQRQYASAITAFQKAIQENPNDSKAYYYLGASYLAMGDTKDAALNLALSNQKQPNPSLQAYMSQLKARLTPEDQQWVDSQLAAAAHAGGAKKPKFLGFRLEPSLTLLSLSDFMTNAQTNQAAATKLQASDGSYTFSANYPIGCANVALEPILRLTPNLELGIPLGFMPVGLANDNTSNSGGTTITDSFQISAISAGVNIRYLIGSGSFQPFIAAGGLLAPININYSYSYSSSSMNPVGTATASGNFTSMAFGGQVQLGLDWHLGDTFVISPFAAYQLASANSFTSSITSSGSNSGQAVQLSMVPTVDGNVATPTVGGNLVLPIATSAGVLWPGTPAPAGTRPLSVDLSGLNAGLQISVFF